MEAIRQGSYTAELTYTETTGVGDDAETVVVEEAEFPIVIRADERGVTALAFDDHDGDESFTVNLERTAADEFSGTWRSETEADEDSQDGRSVDATLYRSATGFFIAMRWFAAGGTEFGKYFFQVNYADQGK